MVSQDFFCHIYKVYEKRYYYDYLSKGLLIYKAPSMTAKGEEKYLGYVTNHALVEYKKGLNVAIVYKNVRFIFSVNKYNARPSTGTDANKLREIVLKLIYNVDKQLSDAIDKQLDDIASNNIALEELQDNVEFDESDF